MSLRTKVDIQVAVGFDNDLDDTGFERALTELLDTTERLVTQTISLAAAETDYEVSFADVAEARLIYIEADGALTYRIGFNGSERALVPMAPTASTQLSTLKAYSLATEVAAPPLYLTNPSSTDARKVKVCIVGDLTT